jgi:hypothetical protein
MARSQNPERLRLTEQIRQQEAIMADRRDREKIAVRRAHVKESESENLRRSAEDLRSELRAAAHRKNELMRQLRELDRDPRINEIPSYGTVVSFNRLFRAKYYSFAAIFVGTQWYVTQNGQRSLPGTPSMTHEQFIEWIGKDTQLHKLVPEVQINVSEPVSRHPLSQVLFGDDEY